MQLTIKEQEGHFYSDIEHYIPAPEVLNGLVRKINKADFYSAIDGITRHKYGRMWFESTTGRFTVKISECHLHDPNIIEVEIDAWENWTEEERHSKFNIGWTNSSILPDVVTSVYTLDELNAKITEISLLIIKLEAERQSKAEAKALEDKLEQDKLDAEIFENSVEYVLQEGLKSYNKASKKKKLELIHHVEITLQKHIKALEERGFSSSHVLAEAGTKFLEIVKN